MIAATRRCTIEGCNRPAKSPRAELCNLHDVRVRRYGDPHVLLQLRDGRSAHPFYIIWGAMRMRARAHGQEVEPRWRRLLDLRGGGTRQAAWQVASSAGSTTACHGERDNVEWRPGPRRVGGPWRAKRS